jgi:tripartite-type tricarboxylate transporter receptor subunit TctC
MFYWVDRNKEGAMVPSSISIFAVLVIAGCAFGPGCPDAAAQSYPAKPIRLIVPFPAGGVVDIVARVVAQKLSDEAGQPIVIDNRSGAAGTVGLEAASKAPPDGYTLVLGTTGTLASAPALYPSLGYDPLKSFVPVSQLVNAPYIVVVHPSLPANSLKSLVAFAKSRPGELNYGSAGAGGPPHVAGEMFRIATGTNLLHVPYKGLTTGISDLATGRIHIMFNQIAPFLPYIKADRLRPLAVAAPGRIPQLPGIPTSAESGYPGYEVSIWFGLLAPAGTPAGLIARLNTDTQKVLSSKEVRDSFSAQGFDSAGGSPDQFAQFIASEAGRWSRAIKAAGVKLD